MMKDKYFNYRAGVKKSPAWNCCKLWINMVLRSVSYSLILLLGEILNQEVFPISERKEARGKKEPVSEIVL
jgi:uracil-DNA glycosylase